MRRFLQLALLAVVLYAPCTPRVAAADDPKAVSPVPYFRHAEFGALALSPSGRYLAGLVPVEGRVGLAVRDLDTKVSRVVANMKDGDVVWFAWVNDRRLVLSGRAAAESLHLRFGSGIYAVNVDGTEFKGLSGGFHSTLEDGSDDIMAPAYPYGGRYPELGRIDTKTGKFTLKTWGKPGDVVRWVVDRKGDVRAAVTDEKTLASKVFWRADENSPWVSLGEFKLGEPRMFPLAFDGDGSLIVASNLGRDTFAVYRYDTEKKALGEELAAHPQSDLTGGILFDRRKNRVVGIAYDGPRPGTAWFDEDWARTQKAVDAALPDHVNRISGNGRRVLVYSYSDTDPGAYYLFDAEARRLEFVAAPRKVIRPETMPTRTPIRYTARDGLEIPGYLTLPKGREPKALPVVVLVHGGPFVRGTHWAWSGEAAYLAALGYAVLEPEFRGSGGWGRALHVAGWKQWGRGMLDDLNDGVDWLAREGTVDARRACIMGASYGGYAVMMSLARDPERWRCGINALGVTDINLFFDVTWSDYAYSNWIDYAAKLMVGDQAIDAAMLKASSPLENAARIRAPVLMAYGMQDRRVPIVHGEKMRDALKANGNALEWVVYPEEGHGFFVERNRYDFYGRVAAFLRANNPPD